MQSLGLNLISKILQEASMQDFLKLRREYFYQEEEKKAFAFVDKHLADHGALPSLELLVRRKLVTEPDTPEPTTYWLDEYFRRALVYRMGEMVPRLNEAVIDKNPEAGLKMLSDFQTEVNSIESSRQRELTTMADLGDAVIESALQARFGNGVTGVPTGWPYLDEQTGGWQRGGIYLILARPKKGKSTMMLQSASAAHSEGFRPLMISMEMTQSEMAQRFFAIKASINLRMMKHGKLSTFGEDRLRQAVEIEKQREVPFHIIEGRFKKTINDIKALVHGLQPDVVFIDGAYLIRLVDNKRAKAKWEIVTEVAEEIKMLNDETQIPIVVSFQLNRDVRKNKKTGKTDEVGFENIQLADAIGQLATAALSILDDDDPESATTGDRRKIQIVGGRHGEEGTFYIRWDWERMDFSEIRDEYTLPEWREDRELDREGMETVS